MLYLLFNLVLLVIAVTSASSCLPQAVMHRSHTISKSVYIPIFAKNPKKASANGFTSFFWNLTENKKSVASNTENRVGFFLVFFFPEIHSIPWRGWKKASFKIVCFPGKKIQVVCITGKKNSKTKLETISGFMCLEDKTKMYFTLGDLAVCCGRWYLRFLQLCYF